MIDNYLLIHKSVIPDYFEKVLYARKLIETGEVKDVTRAVEIAGISRSTYYKYKDYIQEPGEMNSGRIAVVTVMLPHKAGALRELLTKISDARASIITITQAPPIRGRAEVTISMDVSEVKGSTEELVTILGAKLVAIE